MYRTTKYLILACIFTLLIVGILELFTPSPNVVLIIPDDLNGSITLVSKTNTWWKPSFLMERKFSLRVPLDGILLLDDDRVFSVWHSQEIMTSSGLIVLQEGDPFDSQKIASYSKSQKWPQNISPKVLTTFGRSTRGDGVSLFSFSFHYPNAIPNTDAEEKHNQAVDELRKRLLK